MAARPHPAILELADDAKLDEPLYAVNLLDRRRPRLYDLYNLLAYPAARRVGARPLVKGTHGRLAGGDGEVRETLLIVGYRDAPSFVRLASNPWFLIISVLRKLGLEGFQFGFTRRLDGGPSQPPGGKGGGKSGELLALFWSPDAEPEIGEVRRRVSAAGSTLAFFGARKAALGLDRGDGRGPRPTRLAPALPHGHVAVVTGHPRTLTPLADELPAGAAFAVLYRRSL